MTAKKIAVQPFDSAYYLDTPEDIDAYLDEVFADGDEALIAQALGVIARSKGMARIAEETNLARASLYRAPQRNREPRTVDPSQGPQGAGPAALGGTRRAGCGLTRGISQE